MNDALLINGGKNESWKEKGFGIWSNYIHVVINRNEKLV